MPWTVDECELEETVLRSTSEECAKTQIQGDTSLLALWVLVEASSGSNLINLRN
jgi:hypothetical protein